MFRFSKVGGALISIFFCLAALNGEAKAASEPKEVATILSIERQMAAAQTAEQTISYFDQNIVLDDIIPGRIAGKEKLTKDFQAQMAHIKNLKMTISDVSAEADSQLAFAYSMQHLTADGVGGGPNWDMIIRQVDCYHKVGGKWLLVYQNASVPVDYQTGRAVFNQSTSTLR